MLVGSSQLLSRMSADSEMPGLLIFLEKLKISAFIGKLVF